METHENEQYVTFPLSGVHNAIQENIISHEEICDPVDECVLQEGLTEVSVTDVNSGIGDTQVAVEILAEHSDEEDEAQVVYPIYIKQEEQQQYTSGDDESMAVEALRQLGGMYPCFEDKKVMCPNCTNHFTQSELTKHRETCTGNKLSCTTCGERFERKIDLNNHIVCHQVDRPHACRTCGNLFKSKSNLRCHMLQVHEVVKPHKCTICGADFQRPSSLSNHMKIHTYVAGRAIMQAQGENPSQSEETFRKWPENMSDSQNTHDPLEIVSNIQNYDSSQVQWSVSSYNFANEQANISTVSNHQNKLDGLQEFTVMPNGEVTQFEYNQQTNINNQPYNLPLNSFGNQDDMIENRKTYSESETTGSRSHLCKHCGISFSRGTALASHEKTHSIKGWSMPIECEYCDKQFQDENHLASHQMTCAKKMMQDNMEQGVPNNKWGKHACSECGKKFTTKQKMFRHQWIHRKKTHSCEVCGSQFEKQNELDEHRLSAHPGDSPFTCTECGKSFVSRQGLWEHGRTHAGSPAHFHCDTCSKTFSSRQGYLIHHRTHTGERPYGCKFCWKAFRDGGTLRKHERIHTGERPHVCPLCSRAFNQKVVLREHVRWVHAAGKNETEVTGPPFPCPLCGALNQDRDELCAHIVKHSDQMIAEAKAKTNNNAPKPKSTKKKSKAAGTRSQTKQQQTVASRAISRNEQEEALLSIAEPDKAENQQIISEQHNNSYLIVATEKRSENFITISEIKSNNLQLMAQDKQAENIQVSTNEEMVTESIRIMDKQNDSSHIITTEHKRRVHHSATSQNEVTAIHLIQSTKQNNTLHLISKQNESLPVLAVPNPQEHDNFSSQIVEINNTDTSMDVVTEHTPSSGNLENHKDSVQEVLIQDDISQTTVMQVVPYHQNESDDCEELVCGICGEDFNDKNQLITHVKIHI